MTDKNVSINPTESKTLFDRVSEIISKAKISLVRSVNTAQVVSYWLIGQEIVNEEQQGKSKADYGKNIIEELAKHLSEDFGKGYSAQNLWLMRQFYQNYQDLIPDQKILHALRRELKDDSGAGELQSLYSVGRESWSPGMLSGSLSWTHYRTLIRVDNKEARSFYEIESINNNWSARELERQINSLLYDRLALSKDKEGLLELAQQGQVVSKPSDVFKDPFVMEFLGLPESHKLSETKLEQALIENLQQFLLELGKGFAFIARQQRLTLEGDHFYIDLVFYHTILKCYVIIDLKTSKLTHQDLGQLQLYVNYYDREKRNKDDNPTLGLILCTDKNETVVKYTLGDDQQQQIFASRYKLYVPSEQELKQEIERELEQLRPLDVDHGGNK